MRSYENNAVKWKKRTVIVLSLVLLAAVGTLTWVMNRQSEQGEPTVSEDVDVTLQLPDTPAEEKVILPFTVEAQTEVDYFDGAAGEIDQFTKFEDVYRSSQGIDYTFNGEEFPIVAMLSGTISDVREDELFGKSVELTCGSMVFTLQSLSEVSVQKGDEVSQGDVIGKAGTCVYSPDLGAHLHLVSEHNGVIVDPESVIDKTLTQLDEQ